MPCSLNYLLLKLTDKNQVLYGFHAKTPIPKRALVYVKENRLKRSRDLTDCRDPLALKLFALLSEVALKKHQTPKEFLLSPQIGLTVTIDRELQKLTNFVLKKQIPCPRDPHPLIAKQIRDSLFGDIPPPSSDFLDDRNAGREGGGGGRFQHVALRPPSQTPPFGAVIQKILPPGLARMYEASGCKPFTLSARRDNDDDDEDEYDDRPSRPRLPHINVGGGGQAPHIQPPPLIPPPPPPHQVGKRERNYFSSICPNPHPCRLKSHQMCNTCLVRRIRLHKVPLARQALARQALIKVPGLGLVHRLVHRLPCQGNHLAHVHSLWRVQQMRWISNGIIMSTDMVTTRRASLTSILAPLEPAVAWRGTVVKIKFHAVFPMPTPPNIRTNSLTMMMRRRRYNFSMPTFHYLLTKVLTVAQNQL